MYNDWNHEISDKPNNLPGVGGTPLRDLGGDVPLDRVWFLSPLS